MTVARKTGEFLFVGAEPPEDAYPHREAFVVFETAPSKADKAAIKKATKWKVAFQKRLMSITLPASTPQRPLIALLTKTHQVLAIDFALRGFDCASRGRSEMHRRALDCVVGVLEELESDVTSTKNTIGRRLATTLLFEVYVDQRPLSRSQEALLQPVLQAAVGAREREFGMTLVNTPELLMAQLEPLVWDERDALVCLGQVVDRILSWGEDLAGVHLEAALELTRRMGDQLPGNHDEGARAVANALWLAFRAGLLADARLADRIEPLVKTHGADASYGFVYGDLRRTGDDERFVALADAVLPQDAQRLYDAGCWNVSRSVELALDVFDRACRAPNPPWQAANNGVGMLLTLYPREVPADLVALWRARIEACTEAPARHNLACLLCRLGEIDEGRAALLEAIEGGADLEPIAGDREMVGILDAPEVIAALDARVDDEGARARFEAMRLLALGRPEDAMQSLIAAARAGYDPNELKYGDAFEPLHDHPDMKKVRRPAKRKKR